MSAITEVGVAIVKERRARLEEYGDQLLFYTKALAAVPRAVTHYRREVLNILAEVAFGVFAW